MWLLLVLPGVVSVVLDPIVAAAFPEKPYTRFVVQVLGMPLVVLAMLCWLAMTSVMSLIVVGGPVSTVRESFARPLHRMLALAGLGCLVLMAAGPPLTVLLVLATRITELRAPAGMLHPPVYLALTLASLLIGIRLGWALLAVLLTARGPIAALQHSWALTRGHVLQLVPYGALVSAPNLVWAVHRFVVPPATVRLMPPPPAGLAQSLVAIAGQMWLIYGTALALLLWYRLRAHDERLTLASAALEIGFRIPKP